MSSYKSSIGKTLVIVALGASIGFGAVYAITGAGDNPGVGEVPAVAERAAKPVATLDANGRQMQSIPFETSERLTDLGAASRTASTSGNAGLAVVPPRPLSGPNGEKLNRGEMTTFVFKDEPMSLPEASFNGPDGQPMTLSAFKGRVVLLNLWATWCAPCRKEMPYLDKLQRELGSDAFEVVALSVDRGSSDKPRKFLEELGATALKLYHDPAAQMGFTLKAIGMPATLLIDRQGRELGRLVGPAEWHGEDAKRLIKAAIWAGD